MSHFDKREVAERFIRYASIFTGSEEGVETTPSTACQRDLAKLLYEELLAMGASDVYYDEKNCYVYASIPGNIPADPEKTAKSKDAAAKRRENTAPIIGLVAHMDTSDAVRASAVHPQLIECYDGTDIVLNKELGIVSTTEEFPDLKERTGKMLIVTDGTSVLGGDDKAGVTQIMEVFDFYLHHPEIAHGTIRLCFTPDEEVGNGPLNFDVERFAADYAYTVDGSRVGDLEYENFNAASARIVIHGHSTHPGDAKGVMINAALVAMEFNALLPSHETPYYTEGYQGFFHLTDMEGTCDEAKLEYIIRDHDRTRFEERKALMQRAADTIKDRYGNGILDLEMRDSYYNMAEKVLPHRHLIDVAAEAVREQGLEPTTFPIRGGTDGCRLSYMGIPCPNLGTGAYHFHSRYEYVVADEMVEGAEILLRILNKYAAYELD